MNILKSSAYSSPLLDNFVYKLCYRWTVLLLITFSSVVTCRLLLGDSFMCTSDSGLPQNYLNLKCYADTTYTIPSKLIIQRNAVASSSMDNFRRYQSYYPWVNLMLLFHAFNFYLPHLLWKTYEGGYMRRLTSGVEKFFDKEERRGLELCYLAKYVLITQGKHKVYTSLYLIFESWNHIISLGQTMFLLFFFNVTGVPDFLPFTLVSWSDFRQFYFPPTGICELTKLTASESAFKITAMCELPLNRFYMTMFLFLHGWYICITILTGMVSIFRIASLLKPVRYLSFKLTEVLVETPVLKVLCYQMSYTDWFFLTRLQKTMADVDFAQMIDKVMIISQGKDPHKEEDKSSLLGERLKDFENSRATSPV